MKKKPMISIIISYYKKKKFIERTIQSILNQTFKDYELIFVYDDEDITDLNLIRRILSRFKKKKIIINKKNLGVAKCRNIAIKNSQGNYLAFIDADDIWKKNKLSVQLKFMNKNKLLFSFTSYSIIDQKNNLIKTRKVLKDANYKNLYRSNSIGLSTVMINKKLKPKLKFPQLQTQEDYGLWLKLAKNGVILKHLSQSLSSWRITQGSLSSNIFLKLRDAFKIYYYYEKKNFMFAIYSVIILSFNKLIKKFT